MMNVRSIFSSATDPLSALSAPSTSATGASSSSASLSTSAAASISVSGLARRLQQASQTGDLSSLTPAHGRHGGHHHHGGGSSSASAAAAYQQNTDAFGAASASTITGDEAQPQTGGIPVQALTQAGVSTAFAAQEAPAAE